MPTQSHFKQNYLDRKGTALQTGSIFRKTIFKIAWRWLIFNKQNLRSIIGRLKVFESNNIRIIYHIYLYL